MSQWTQYDVIDMNLVESIRTAIRWIEGATPHAKGSPENIVVALDLLRAVATRLEQLD